MTTVGKIRDEKLRYDINREGIKILVLSSRKTDKYEYHTGEEILLPNQNKVVEHAQVTYSNLGKTLEKQTKKQLDSLMSLNLSSKIE